MGAKFYGPYLIKKRVEKVAYELDLPTGSSIHHVVHVSLLKKHHGSADPPKAEPINMGKKIEEEVPIAIL